MTPVRDPAAMIRLMASRRRPGEYVFVTAPGGADPAALGVEPVMTFAEDEGQTWILPAAAAQALGWEVDVPLAWITLDVVSALDGVGLTAAVSGALAAEGIACNVVAARHHDHLFIPVADADRAVTVLRQRARAQDPQVRPPHR